MHIVYDENTEIFIKGYRSFLKAQGEMNIDQFILLYQKMAPALHPKAALPEPDIEAFVYAMFRLPEIIFQIKKIVLAPTDIMFKREGYDLTGWERVTAPARRRKMLFNGVDTLAVFINSVTDLDDLVTILTAFQIEWNKIHGFLAQMDLTKQTDPTLLTKRLKIHPESWRRMEKIWDGDLIAYLSKIQTKTINFRLNLLKGSYVDYQKAAQRWLGDILNRTTHLGFHEKPVYFVSSNTHSLVNNITGWVNRKEKDLIEYLKTKKMSEYLTYWDEIDTGDHPGSRENFLWYILKKYEREHIEVKLERIEYEQSLGIDYLEAHHFLDIDVQVLALNKLASTSLKDKLGDVSHLEQSDAYILNIDYPLGFGAYMVLSPILRNFRMVQGVYVLGKASFLHGNLGDIGLPSTVLDSYSKNLFIFRNAFTPAYFKNFRKNSVLIDQKALSTRGTLLQSEQTSRQYFAHDFTLIEMENGSYLNAMYETINYERYPENATINLLNSPIDLGIIHYASDTPYTKAITLGTRSLGYEGVEATYTASFAIMQRIVEMEKTRLSK